MERVAEILRALLGRALSEHGPQAPALADVLIERAQSHLPPQLGVQLSNGYRAWAPLSPADCYAFCERHGTWDLASLRAALLREGHAMYLRDARGPRSLPAQPASATRRAGACCAPGTAAPPCSSG